MTIISDATGPLDRLALPDLSAEQLYGRLRSLPDPVWLDTSVGEGRHILVADPVEHINLTGTTTDYANLRQLARKRNALKPAADIAFSGGLVGYFAYESNHKLNRLAARQPATGLGQFGLYDWAVQVDAETGAAELLIHPQCDPSRRDRVLHCLRRDVTPETLPFRLKSPFRPREQRDDYEAKVGRVIDYLLDGDCYQVNLSHTFDAQFEGDLLDAYLALRESSGGMLGALMEFDSHTLMSLSPERFLRVQGRQVETWPIKGTAPRSTDAAEDQQIATSLVESEKNRAENLMIVDLMRNDLSRVCEPGSIHTLALNQLHSYALVHHLVSRVEGRLEAGRDHFDLFAACLPGGSITGAPKRRAMQIIDQLEPSARGPYCGSVAYFSCCGNTDSSIAIRTFLAHQGQLELRAGGGIVADSDPAQEYEETLHKVQAYMQLLQASFSN